MQKLYSHFPGGAAGLGLLILRIAAGAGIAFCGITLMSRLESLAPSQFLYFSHLILGVVMIAGSIFLVLGLVMPFVLVVLAGAELIAVYVRLTADLIQGEKPESIETLLLLASITIALFFLGPGAFSLDARRYGRKRIFIPALKKDKNGKE